MTMDIQPIEADDQFWVCVSMDGGESRQHGPFASADMAKAMAARLAAICHAMHTKVRMQAAASNG